MTWTFIDQEGTHTITEEEILLTYYPWWQKEMRKVGKESEISEASCIEDWAVVNWAWRTPEEEGLEPEN